jgi:hypothetical protein
MADTKQPIVNDVSAPSIARHTGGLATEAVEDPKSSSDDTKLVSNIGTKIAPLDTTLQANSANDTTPVAENENVGTTETTAQAEEKTEQPAPEKQEKTGPASPYEAVDSLPDMSEKKTTELTNQMDAPRIYDTKEYIVPIKDTMHSHGGLGIVIAGIVSAVVVVGGIVGAVYFLV